MKKSTQSKIQTAAGVFIALIFLVLGVMWWRNWLPFPDFLIDPVVLFAAFVVFLIGLFGYKYTGKATQRNLPEYFNQEKQSQLTDREAFELLRYELFFNRNIRIKEVHSRGTRKVNPQDREGDPVQLYTMKFDRVNVDESVGVVLDLEQELSVDAGSRTSMESAADEIRNIRVIRGKKVDDLDESLEDAVSSLGQSLNQKITEKHYEDGEMVREKTQPVQAYLRKMNPANDTTTEVE